MAPTLENTGGQAPGDSPLGGILLQSQGGLGLARVEGPEEKGLVNCHSGGHSAGLSLGPLCHTGPPIMPLVPPH